MGDYHIKKNICIGFFPEEEEEEGGGNPFLAIER